MTRNGRSSAPVEEQETTRYFEEERSRPDPEVLERPTRRHFSARYKLDILEKTDNLPPGQVGALLRREGLYYSNLTAWRRQREAGVLTALEARKRGRKEAPEEARLARRVAQLEREKAALQEQLRKSQLILEVQKKVLSLCERTDADVGKSNPS